jgi:hypothetical protein
MKYDEILEWINKFKRWFFVPEHWTLGTKGETLVFMRVCGVAVHFYLL